jgi:hypothetical protein
MLVTIMVIDAHLKNVNCVNYMKKKEKNTVITIRGKIETPHTQIHGCSLSLYT